MKTLKKLFVIFLKSLDLGSAVAVRLTKITGKSKIAIHPKHLITPNPWFTKYIKTQDIILDLGCGNGQNSIKAAKIAKKVIGIEISRALLKTAKETANENRIKNVEFETGNLEEKLKYKNQAFKKIIFLDVLEHLRKRDQILTEARRIMKKNGLMFVGVPNSETSWKKFQRSAGVNSFSDPDHKIEFSETSIRQLLKKNGFEIVHFGYGKYDIPARGVIDIFGAISSGFYKQVTDWRAQKALKNPIEAAGFEIVAKKK